MHFDAPDLIKTQSQIEVMREAGKHLGNILVEIKEMIKPGVKTMDLEAYFIKRCNEIGAIPACKGYSVYDLPPFPTGLCISINDDSVHCFPKEDQTLEPGDIITVDTVIKYKGMHVDSSFAKGVGEVSPEDQELLNTSQEALMNTISRVSNGVKVGELSETMERTARKHRCNVLKDYAGHGIGVDMHSNPDIPCYGSKHNGPKLKTGMTICIEALTCQGSDEVINTSEWETKMYDGKKFAQFEHTVLVTDKGYEILTLPNKA